MQEAKRPAFDPPDPHHAEPLDQGVFFIDRRCRRNLIRRGRQGSATSLRRMNRGIGLVPNASATPTFIEKARPCQVAHVFGRPIGRTKASSSDRKDYAACARPELMVKKRSPNTSRALIAVGANMARCGWADDSWEAGQRMRAEPGGLGLREDMTRAASSARRGSIRGADRDHLFYVHRRAYFGMPRSYCEPPCDALGWKTVIAVERPSPRRSDRRDGPMPATPRSSRFERPRRRFGQRL